MRPIDADALEEMLREQAEHQWFGSVEARMHFCDKVMFAIDCVSEAPTLDVHPVRRGEWKVTDAWPHKVYCANCFTTFAKSTVMGDVDAKSVPRPHFCPNCGADMRKEEHHEPED